MSGAWLQMNSDVTAPWVKEFQAKETRNLMELVTLHLVLSFTIAHFGRQMKKMPWKSEKNEMKE